MLVITAFQRSGTTALGEQLGGDPGLAYWGEIFHPEGYRAAELSAKLRLRSAANWFRFADDHLPAAFKTGPQDETLRGQAWALYDAHLRELGSGRRPVLDIKYNSWHHLEPVWSSIGERPFFFGLLAQQGAVFAHLVRDNVLAQALSEVFAFESGLWHRNVGQTLDTETLSFSADIEGLLTRMRTSRRETALIREWLRPFPHAELIYEKAFDERGAISGGTRMALAVLGVELQEGGGGPVLGRIGQDPREWLANRDAVVDALTGTEFEDLIELTL